MPRDSLKDYLLNTPSREKWAKIGTHKRAGLLAPLFCFYSSKSLGVADFADLKLLIDWARECGFSILQLLPFNEIGPLSCPYDSLSSFALEPLYLCLDQISGKLAPEIKRAKEEFACGQGYVDYRVKQRKIGLLREIFKETPASGFKGLESFREENRYWVEDFALYKTLKAYHGQKPWYEWEPDYCRRQSRVLDSFSQRNEKEILFEIWLQWQLSKQFRQAGEYAKKSKILLKGDLPLLVSRDSADVWAHQEFFKLEFAAGAPPDMYCAKGQRWGMPPYNWEKVAQDNYRYLKEKLRYAGEFYHILRIDHVVGLLRIWSIPYDEPLENQGLNGFFDPGEESKWPAQGRELLSVMLSATDMLLCAEDLGIIPPVCKEILRELGIPGNEVQRWVKDWQTKHDFLAPREYRPLSVAMLSTHDTTSWPAWWENEAGTVDEELFQRKCRQHGIDYPRVKEKLFNSALSGRGRLRWQESIESEDILAGILVKNRQEIADIIEIYRNTYREKKKLWGQLGLPGPVSEACRPDILSSALRITLGSESIFCIESILDLLSLGGMLPGDSYKYRINTPGTIAKTNWSLTIPLGLEELTRSRLTADIKNLVLSCDRAVKNS